MNQFDQPFAHDKQEDSSLLQLRDISGDKTHILPPSLRAQSPYTDASLIKTIPLPNIDTVITMRLPDVGSIITMRLSPLSSPSNTSYNRKAQEVLRTLHLPAMRLASDAPVRLRLNLLIFVLIYVGSLSFNLFVTGPLVMQPLNLYLTLVWSLYLPLSIIGLVGAIGTWRLRATRFEGTVERLVIFTIPTIARHDTVPAMKRVIDSILSCAPQHLARFLIHVVTEEGAEGLQELRAYYHGYTNVEFLIVPKEYQTPRNTRYKARANHYAVEYRRAKRMNTKDVFIYHSDDDTGIGPDTVWSIARFIAQDKGKFDLAQGVLTYPYQLSKSWFCKLADSVRPADDLTRFHFFTGMVGSPLAGLHGEHLLVRANVEDQVGWDFGEHVTVEDAYFGIFFSQWFRGHSTFLESCSYGASPESIGDLIKQRRRWAKGLFGLLFDAQIALRTRLSLSYAVIIWITGLMQHVGLVLLAAYLLHAVNTSPVLAIFVFIWSFNFSYHLWLYIEGLRINLDASQAKKWKYFVFPWVVIILMPVFTFVEAWAAVLGLIDFLKKKSGFVVITKRI